MKKGQLAVIRLGAPVLIQAHITVGKDVEPTLRYESLTVRPTPVARIAVRGPRKQRHEGVLGNMNASYKRIADGYAACGRDWWVQSQDLLTHGVEPRKLFENLRVVHGVVEPNGVELLAQLRLVVLILWQCEDVSGPSNLAMDSQYYSLDMI